MPWNRSLPPPSPPSSCRIIVRNRPFSTSLHRVVARACDGAMRCPFPGPTGEPCLPKEKVRSFEDAAPSPLRRHWFARTHGKLSAPSGRSACERPADNEVLSPRTLNCFSVYFLASRTYCSSPYPQSYSTISISMLALLKCSVE